MDPQKAKDLVCQYFHRLLNEKDIAVCDEVLSPAYVDHDAPPETPPGPASIKDFVSGFLDDHPDMCVTVEDVSVRDNKVAARLTWKGTNRHTGALFHQVGAVIIVLDEAGRFVERWSAYEPVN
jgi:predicted SnoaL-like aldol condensation-catalyzing enzyme